MASLSNWIGKMRSAKADVPPAAAQNLERVEPDQQQPRRWKKGKSQRQVAQESNHRATRTPPDETEDRILNLQSSIFNLEC